MDKITKAVLNHKAMNETTAVFKAQMSIGDKGKAEGSIRGLSNFFQEIISHFDFEERGIFSTVLAVGDAGKKHLVRLLQQEHISILDRIDEFKDLVLKHGFHPNDSQAQELTNLSKEIIEMILNHSRKEDAEFYPFLKEIDFKP